MLKVKDTKQIVTKRRCARGNMKLVIFELTSSLLTTSYTSKTSTRFRRVERLLEQLAGSTQQHAFHPGSHT